MKDLVPTLLRQDNRIIDFIITVLYNEKNKKRAQVEGWQESQASDIRILHM